MARNSGDHADVLLERPLHVKPSLERPRAGKKRHQNQERPFKQYTVQFEEVTAKKRKLQSTMTFDANPPPGFGFIPIGFGEVSAFCKELCRTGGRNVYLVSDKPKHGGQTGNPDRITSHVHRTGYHLPLEFIQAACKKYGYSFTPLRGLQKLHTESHGSESYSRDEHFDRRLAQHHQALLSPGHLAINLETKEHISGAVYELFPKIPQEAMAKVIKHAFKKGTDRVGNAQNLSLPRRVQLAVGAHIRHKYTEYDKILRSKHAIRPEARKIIEPTIVAKYLEWADLDDSESNELEDTFREIILLDDDDDDDDDIEEISSDDDTDVEERDPSTVILSNRSRQQPAPIDRQPYAQHIGRVPPRTGAKPSESRFQSWMSSVFSPNTLPPSSSSYVAGAPGTYPVHDPRPHTVSYPAPPPVHAEYRPPPPPPAGTSHPLPLSPARPFGYPARPIAYPAQPGNGYVYQTPQANHRMQTRALPHVPVQRIEYERQLRPVQLPRSRPMDSREPTRAPRFKEARGENGLSYILDPVVKIDRENPYDRRQSYPAHTYVREHALRAYGNHPSTPVTVSSSRSASEDALPSVEQVG